MPIGIRIVKAKRKDQAFSGEGSRRVGGRWTSQGLPAVYVSSSLSLATLEILVHLNPRILSAYCSFEIEIPDDVVEVLEPKKLPKNWRDSPAPLALRSLGDAWFGRRSSVALRVPSAIVASEFNFVLNPTHPDFAKLVVHPAKAYGMDSRLV